MKAAIVFVILTFLVGMLCSGCGVPSARDNTSTTASSHANHDTTLADSPSTYLAETLREDMTEIEVARTLAVTHVDEKHFLWGGPLSSKIYICRGSRFPSKMIKCSYELVWVDEANDLAAWKLKRWSVVEDEDTIAELKLEPVESNYAINRVTRFAEGLKAARETQDSVSIQ